MWTIRARFLFCVFVFVTACSHYDNYAPVFSSNSDKSLKDVNKNHINQKKSVEKPLDGKLLEPSEENQVTDVKEPKYYLVKPGETLYSIGVKTKLGFENLSKWNNISAPYSIKLGQKLKLSDSGQHKEEIPPVNTKTNDHFLKKSNTSEGSKGQQQSHKSASKTKTTENIAVKKAKNNQKSSIISIDKEKMLKLSFEWPVKGKVLKNFSQTNNKGIDIAGSIGHSVIAAHDGKVAYSGQGLIGFGKVLIIKHDAQYLSAYANVGQIEVGEGQQVEKGQLIAKIGQSGSKKASLHFEIRKNGKPVNPLKYLPK